MAKKTIADVNVKGKRVLIRVDFNVPIENGQITDDKRIREALPTIKRALEQGGKVILMSHLGRPKGPQDKAKYSMKPTAEHLAKLLGKPVNHSHSPDVIGPEVKKMVDALREGEVLMLENLRIYEAETKNGMDFAKELASYGDIYRQAMPSAPATASTPACTPCRRDPGGLASGSRATWSRRNSSSSVMPWPIRRSLLWRSWAGPRSPIRSA